MKVRNIAIVMCRCTRDRRCFGLRLERVEPRMWAATWAFAIKEAAAKKEGYDHAVIEGSFLPSREYPGCPHCHAPSFFGCNCGAVGCWDGRSQQVVCPGCGERIELNATLTSLKAGSDR
jgi:hypothetical protein